MGHGPQTLLLEMFAIFLAAKVTGEIFERLSLPAVLGEILAGALVGPFALGWVQPSEFTHSIAEIGAIFVLFHAGLETSPSDLIRVGPKALLVAISGIVLPFLLGYGYMHLRGESSTESIFVGAAMVATSVGITARVLGDLGVLSSSTAKIILGAAVFDDILGMLLLAVVEGLARSEGIQWIRLSVVAIEAIMFAVFMIFVGPHIVRRASSKVQHLSTRHASLIIALLVCLFLSWLSTVIGMAAIIGAFFAGMIFADYAGDWELLPRVHAITEFLGPFFFFSIGAQLNPRLFTGDVLITAIVITGLAIFSKVVGCGLPVLKDGWHSVFAVGVGMMPRGEVALIIALVGLNSKIVTQSIYAIVVFMTAITTLLAPPLLRVIFRKERLDALAAARESGQDNMETVDLANTRPRSDDSDL